MALRYKIQGQAIFRSAFDERRFDALMAKLGAYDTQLEPHDVLVALHWAKKKLASNYTPKHDPIEFADRLVDLARADTATVIASILDPALRPDSRGNVSESDFGEIKGRFGDKVHNIVCATLALSQVEYRPLRIGFKNNKPRSGASSAEQLKIIDEQEARQKKHLRDFRYMALFASSKYLKEMPNAILNRGTRYLFDVETGRQTRDPVARDKLLMEIKDIYSGLLGITYGVLGVSGFRNMQEALMNEWLRIKQPRIYTQIQELRNQQIGIGHKKKEAMQDAVKLAIHEAMGMTGFMDGNYTVEMHLKTPYSIYKKMREKNISINDLPLHIKDFMQARVIIDAERFQETQGSRQRLDTEYGLCARAHRALASKFDPVLGPFRDPDTRQFVLKDGRLVSEIDLVADKDQIQWVPRFKDYMKRPNKAERAKRKKKIFTSVLGPKRNGYAAMHDGRMIACCEVEVQIVTKERHLAHQSGIAAHGSFKEADYKSESAADQPLIDWARAVTSSTAKPVYWVGAYAGDNYIILRRGPMNVAELTYGLSEDPKTKILNDDKVISCIGAVALDGGGPYSAEGGDTFPIVPQRNGSELFPVDTEVYPGMSVQLALSKGAHALPRFLTPLTKALRRTRELKRALRYMEQYDNS